MANIAILGFGVVGSGVAEVLSQPHLKENQPLKLKYILDIREFPDSPFASCFIKDFSVIENDPSVSIVVETIGGVKAAYDFTKRSLSKGKSVVTSNKELVSAHGAQLLKLARDNNCRYYFEASVGGGTPIIRPISQCLAANKITAITGILNGTTNYILSQMELNGTDFDSALKQAQTEGYAEGNPSDDIDGKDTARKICILASLAFGRHIYPQYVPTEGIGSVTQQQIQWARQNGFAIKLLGSTRLESDGRISILTAPHLVAQDSPLYTVGGVYNGIIVTGDALGDAMFYGRGAGKMPTASAVAADILDCLNESGTRMFWQDTDEDITVRKDDSIWHCFPDGTKMRILKV